MGLIRAAVGAVTSTLNDAYLEIIEARDMDGQTLFVVGENVKGGQNKKATPGVITQGSLIRVGVNQAMLFCENGKILDFCCEPGSYTVDKSSAPSFFSGDLSGDRLSKTLEEIADRFRYGGISSLKGGQFAYFINLQEIMGIPFGTPQPVQYYDRFYDADLSITARGRFSVRIIDPILFFANVVPKNVHRFTFQDMREQFISEFMQCFGAAINQYAADGEDIRFLQSKANVLSKYMQEALDESWKQRCGIEIVKVGIEGMGYDEATKAFIQTRNEGAALKDANIREGYRQKSVADAFKAAANNSAGAMTGFSGMLTAMNGAAMYTNQDAQNNLQQIQAQQAQQGKKPEGTWYCPECGTQNTGKFCSECGAKAPASTGWICPKCGAQNTGKFCSECGTPRS